MILNKKGFDFLKKTLSFLLSILMLIATSVPFSSYAANEQQTSGSCGDNATFELKDGVLTITGTGEITSHPWCNLFETTNINKVIINEGVTVIGENSFKNCTKIKEAILPESLTGIKKLAFYNCNCLETANLPMNLKYIGQNAFKDCKALKKIELPEKLERIYGGAFSGCSSAKGALFLRKKLYIELYAFSYCRGLEEIYFEDGFTIDNFTSSRPLTIFNYCEGVKRLYIPPSMTRIEGALFNNFTSLTDITISEGVEDIGGFNNCTSLEKITLPKSIKNINNYAFYGCKELKSVKIQSKIESLGREAFYNCTSLKSIKFPYGVDSVGKRAFGYYETVDQVTQTAEGGTKEIKSEHKIKNFKVYGKKCKALTDYCKENGFTFIDMYDVKNATVTMKSQTYNGSAKKPSVTVKLAGTTLKKDTDYTVKYSNNTKVGTAKVTITGKGTYKGTLEKTFKINPKPTELTKLTSGSKSFKAYWKKNATQTSGYQIQYSTYKDFKNAKTVSITSYKTGARTIKKLKANKKYFVRIRAYKTINGKKQYSSWSAKKTVTTKK